MSKFTVHDDFVINTRTGVANSINHNCDKTFGVVVMCGHCDINYFIPILYSLKCENKESAIAMAKGLGRVKCGHPNCILAVGEINEYEHVLIRFFNARDKYLSSCASDEEIKRRRVVLPDHIDDYSNYKENSKNIPKYLVKTAEKYGEKWVLQRFFAPTRVGENLVYPKRVNFKELLDEYFYQMTKLFGKQLQKTTPLAYYYQLYGINNPLNIRYDNGMFTFENNEGESIELPAHEIMIPYLDEAKERFLKEMKEQEEKEQEKLPEKPVTIPSARQRFQDKFKKYQDIKDKNKPIK